MKNLKSLIGLFLLAVVSFPASGAAKCGGTTVTGTGLVDIWETVDFSNQIFTIKGVCSANNDTVTLFDFTDSIPEEWNGFSSELLEDGSGGIVLKIYKTDINDLASRSNPIGLNVECVTIHLTSQQLSSACSSIEALSTQGEFKILKLSFRVENNPVAVGDDLVVLIDNPLLVENNYNIYIFNSLGQQIYVAKAESERVVIPRSAIPAAGIYNVKMQNELKVKSIPVIIN